MPKPEQQEFEPTLPCGVPLNEGVSILIKELRAGRELPALYWARQMEKQFYKYLWRRLLIFCAEDVGLANPDAITQINSLAAAYARIREENQRHHVDGNIVTMAVLVLARSPKNREVDNLKNYLHSLENEYSWAPEIPEHAIDAHTARGREKFDTAEKRALHWFGAGAHVENFRGTIDYYLWHLRHLVHKGLLSADVVQRKAEEWDGRGMLAYGLEGPPKPWEGSHPFPPCQEGE